MARKSKYKDRRIESDEEEECGVTEKNATCSQNCESGKEASKGESAGISFEQVTRAIEKVAWEQKSGPGVNLTGGEQDFDAAEGKFGHNPVETCINEVHTAPQRSDKIR